MLELKTRNLKTCADAAAITHGHPLGWLSAAALGNILYDILSNYSLEYAVRDTVMILREHYGTYEDTEVLIELIRKACTLAEESKLLDTEDIMSALHISEELGEGWVGDEALAIGLFCALAAPDKGLDWCLRSAAGHRGDSDSTASIAGQIWGAYYGECSLTQKWLKDLELREVITEIADDLIHDNAVEILSKFLDPALDRKYMCGSTIPRLHEEGPHWYVRLAKLEETVSFRSATAYNIENSDAVAYLMDSKRGYSERIGVLNIGYDDRIFVLLPNPVENCIEILSDFRRNPWVGRIRRKYDYWNNPIEMECQTCMPIEFADFIEHTIIRNPSLHDFFRK